MLETSFCLKRCCRSSSCRIPHTASATGSIVHRNPGCPVLARNVFGEDDDDCDDDDYDDSDDGDAADNAAGVAAAAADGYDNNERS